MPKRFIVAAIFIIVSLSLIPILHLAKKSGASEGGMPPAMVEINAVKDELWQPEIAVVGTLSANQGVIIKPEIDGRITGIYFHSGESTKAGAPLAQINPSILKAQVAGAQAKVILSQANYKRIQDLFKKHVLAQADLDTAFANYQSDQATLENSQALLNQTLIRAPFSGELGLRQVDLGDFVKAGDTITTLQAIDPLRVDFRISEVYLAQIHIGQTVLLHSNSYPNEIFKGKIYAIDSQIDMDTRSLGVRASISNKDHKLLPGAYVNVTVQTSAPQKLISVSETAVMFSADGQYVYRVINNQAVKTPVTLGMRRNATVAVLTGLKPGDKIITVGAFKITDGGPVMEPPPSPSQKK